MRLTWVTILLWVEDIPWGRVVCHPVKWGPIISIRVAGVYCPQNTDLSGRLTPVSAACASSDALTNTPQHSCIAPLAGGGGGGCQWNTALQSLKAVAAYLKSKQLLPFGFPRQNTAPRWWTDHRRTGGGESTAHRRRSANFSFMETGRLECRETIQAPYWAAGLEHCPVFMIDCPSVFHGGRAATAQIIEFAGAKKRLPPGCNVISSNWKITPMLELTCS